MNRPSHVATCIYSASDNMKKMLEVFAYSLSLNADCDLFVYHDGLTKDEKRLVLRANSRTKFIECSFGTKDNNHRPAQKIQWWNFAIIRGLHDHTNLILCDFDMLVIGNVFEAFTECDGGILYTMKDDPAEKYRLNTGIVFVRNPGKSLLFFREWARSTLEIINSDSAEEAVADYGAADQAAFAALTRLRRPFNCSLQSVRASAYNLHKDWGSVPDSCRVIHFKSGWHNVLFRGEDYQSAATAEGWWRRENARAWKPCFDLWRSYYGSLNRKKRNETGLH